MDDQQPTSTVTDPRDRGIIYALLGIAAGVLVIIGAAVFTGRDVAQWAATGFVSTVMTCLGIAATWLQVRRASVTPAQAPEPAPPPVAQARPVLSPLDPPGAHNTPGVAHPPTPAGPGGQD